jgi:hypothetical protein
MACRSNVHNILLAGIEKVTVNRSSHADDGSTRHWQVDLNWINFTFTVIYTNDFLESDKNIAAKLITMSKLLVDK